MTSNQISGGAYSITIDGNDTAGAMDDIVIDGNVITSGVSGYHSVVSATITWTSNLSEAAAVIDAPVSGGGGSYDADATSLFARMGVALSDAQKQATSDFIAGLKTDTVWTELEAFAFFAFPTEQQGLLDWIRTSTSWTVGGTCTHTGLSGIAGNGTTGYISSGVNHNAATAMLQDDAHFYIGMKSLGTGNETFFSTAASSTPVSLSKTSGGLAYRLSATSSGTASGMTTGRYLASRTSSTTITLDKNGTQINTATSNSTARQASDLRCLNNNTLFSDGSVAFMSFGGGLTAAQRTAFDARMATFLAAMSITL